MNVACISSTTEIFGLHNYVDESSVPLQSWKIKTIVWDVIHFPPKRQ